MHTSIDPIHQTSSSQSNWLCHVGSQFYVLRILGDAATTRLLIDSQNGPNFIKTNFFAKPKMSGVQVSALHTLLNLAGEVYLLKSNIFSALSIFLLACFMKLGPRDRDTAGACDVHARGQ